MNKSLPTSLSRDVSPRRARLGFLLAVVGLGAGLLLATPGAEGSGPLALSTCSPVVITSVTLSKVLACSGYCFPSGGCAERDAYDAHIVVNWSPVSGATRYRVRLTPAVPGVFDSWREVTSNSFYQMDRPFRLNYGECVPDLDPPGMPIYAGLDPSTIYLVEVQASCDDGSTWPSSGSTTTAVSWWLDDGGSCANMNCPGGF